MEKVKAMLNKFFVTYILFLSVFIVMSGCSQRPTTPEKAFRITKKAILNNDWNMYWHMLSTESKDKFEKQVQRMQESFDQLSPNIKERMLASMNLDRNRLMKLTGKSFFILSMNRKETEQGDKEFYARDLFKTCRIISTETKDSNAVINIEDFQGNHVAIPLKKEGDDWKLHLAVFYSF